jgi:transcriptional regulator with XRE-family HTH domain
LIDGQTPSSTVFFHQARVTDVRDIIRMAVAGFHGNQAALALELGVTRTTVSRWMSGQSVPEEGSCLRLAKITGRTAADVFRLAGRDTNLLPTELDLLADAELAAHLRQWVGRMDRLSVAGRAAVVGVLDDMVASLCLRLNEGNPRQDTAAPASIRRRRGRSVSAPGGGLTRPSFPLSSADPKKADLESLEMPSSRQRPRARQVSRHRPHRG